MNILTFDIEEWFIEQQYFGNRFDQYNNLYSCLMTILI